MVLCPIARMVHCTGCALVKFCPAKTFLGDYGKEAVPAKGTDDQASKPEAASSASGSEQVE